MRTFYVFLLWSGTLQWLILMRPLDQFILPLKTEALLLLIINAFFLNLHLFVRNFKIKKPVRDKQK